MTVGYEAGRPVNENRESVRLFRLWRLILFFVANYVWWLTRQTWVELQSLSSRFYLITALMCLASVISVWVIERWRGRPWTWLVECLTAMAVMGLLALLYGLIVSLEWV